MTTAERSLPDDPQTGGHRWPWIVVLAVFSHGGCRRNAVTFTATPAGGALARMKGRLTGVLDGSNEMQIMSVSEADGKLRFSHDVQAERST